MYALTTPETHHPPSILICPRKKQQRKTEPLVRLWPPFTPKCQMPCHHLNMSTCRPNRARVWRKRRKIKVRSLTEREKRGRNAACCSTTPCYAVASAHPICNHRGNHQQFDCDAKKGDFSSFLKSATTTFASDWPTKTAWCEGWSHASHASRRAHLSFARSSCLRCCDGGD